MAVFPTSADFRRQAPRPDQQGYRVARPAEIGTADAEALYEQGRQTQQVGGLAGQLAKQLDTAAAQEAISTLRAKRQELTYDPATGFRRFKGGDVLKPGPGGGSLIEELPAGLQKEADAIANSLLSPRAKAAFQQAARSETSLYKRDVAVYFGSETEKHELAVLKDGNATDLTEAALAAGDSARVAALATRAERRTRQFYEARGLPGDASAAAARSNIFRTAVESRLAAGDNRAALTLYDSVADKLDASDRVQLAARLKSTATELEAETVMTARFGLKVPDAVRQYDPLIQQAATESGIRPALGYGLISQESGGVTGAVSSAGARGLTQLMPGTAKDLGVTNPHDPKQAIPGGFKYLKQQLDKYGNERLALMAYNWGPGNLDKWIKTGADPEKVPLETREFVHRVQGYAASFGNKTDVKAVQLDILNDNSLTPAVKASAFAMIQKRQAAVESMTKAQLADLNDKFEATIFTMISNPTSYPKGTLGKYADAYQQAGDMSSAVNARLLAANEDLILTFATSDDAAQRRIIEGLLPGKAKALASGLLAADEKGRSEAGKQAAAELDAIKEATANGIPLKDLQGKVKAAIDLAIKGGAGDKAREIALFAEGQMRAQGAGQLSPADQEQFQRELQDKVRQGDQANGLIKTLGFVDKIRRDQSAAFAKDAYAAGTELYSEVGRPVGTVAEIFGGQADTAQAQLAMRAQQARQISARRGGIAVVPFTDAEVATIRSQIDAAPPDQQARIMSTLSMLPADMIPGVASALAGKQDAGDPLSRSYAAALSLFAERDPARAEIAGQVLRGAKLIKDMGEAGKKPATTSDAWQTELQDKVGNAFIDMGSRVPAVVSDAIASVYVYQMARAGRQGEKTDTGVLDKAIDAVIGKTITRNGQTLLPPKGVDTYRFDGALRTLTDGDTAGLRTLEGDPITADAIVRRGVLSNVGEGLYKVRIPDPRRGGDLSEVQDPTTGRAWLLDIKPLLQRGNIQPSTDANAPDYITNVPPLARPR